MRTTRRPHPGRKNYESREPAPHCLIRWVANGNKSLAKQEAIAQGYSNTKKMIPMPLENNRGLWLNTINDIPGKLEDRNFKYSNKILEEEAEGGSKAPCGFELQGQLLWPEQYFAL